jgi:hypothetical protein
VKRYDLQADYARLVERLRAWGGERLRACEKIPDRGEYDRQVLNASL